MAGNGASSVIWSCTTLSPKRAHAFQPGKGRSVCGGHDRLAIVLAIPIPRERCPQCVRLANRGSVINAPIVAQKGIT